MPERLMAFDFGERQIGVAIGSPLNSCATAIGIVRAKDGKPDWNRMDSLLREWQPGELLVGLPLNMDGSDSVMSARARRFRGRLIARYHLPCEMVDERLTTAAAREQLGTNADKAAIDAQSACLILEDWLRQRDTSTDHQGPDSPGE